MFLKVRKFLHSRFFIGAILLLVELTLILMMILRLYAYFMPFTVFSWLLQGVVILYLVNREGMAEIKIPWLITVMLIPVLGAFLFMLFSSNKASKREYESYRRTQDEARRCFPGERTLSELKMECPAAYGQAMYLKNAAKACILGHQSIRYFESGESFFESLLRDLESARKFILMEYFIVHEGEMWNAIHALLKKKAQEGVKVYFLYDDFGCMSTLPPDYWKTLRREGICAQPANRFRPVISHIHNNRDHRKICVVDAQLGYTGGVNLADEYINRVERFGHWKDTAVRMEGSAVRTLTALFLAGWNMQNNGRLKAEDFLYGSNDAFPAGEVVIPFGDSPAPIDAENIGKNVYLNMINAAVNYVYITTPYLICDHEITSALIRAAHRGVDVRIITPHIPDKKTVFLLTRASYKSLTAAGVRIFEYTPGFIHAKNFVSDDLTAVCGTINLDYRSLVHHFECAVWMYKAKAVRDIKKDFLNTQKVSMEITKDKAQLGLVQGLYAGFIKIFAPLM